MERSSCWELDAALVVASLIARPLDATDWMERDICSIELEVCSTAVARLSVVLPTSSIEAAISLIEEDVSSAADARSVALPDTPSTDRAISSIAAAVSFTDEVSVFAGYAHFFNGFFLDDVPKTDRLFYEMNRVETGVRFEGTIVGFYVDAALTVGYAFQQNFYRGFDARNLDSFSSISDEPYLGIVLIGRF